MDYKTANEYRKFDGGMNWWYHVSTHESDCRRSSLINSVSIQGHKRKLKEMMPDPEELADAFSVVDESNDARSDYDGGHDEDCHRLVKKSRKKDSVIKVEPE
ncbi:hypothetical protein AGABI2DRAFT_122760 [Agaricus bisporus var. bisporus H97]|uniref:hypothetical protein n=1 Tax=Agaricus bisporus var. bisporus (strain H97 / ATCC MYA-4626 / FGSC 10389) TaxID=936046 RepID=UPI00029F5A7F|nr:hypothetical protein AGABI2DRAFT_122760 [Agaricus bisporus var. bisporus H97]EKV42542.1 hypothetical protein AGABI2DRAFT_122760 [Agaricus bisporus var. bisporus H97]